MKLLPRLEAITGEVKCGRHNMRVRLGVSSWCKLPANHTGRCVRGPISGNIGVEEKHDGRTLEEQINEWYPDWKLDECGRRFIFDYTFIGTDWVKEEGPEWEP